MTVNNNTINNTTTYEYDGYYCPCCGSMTVDGIVCWACCKKHEANQQKQK